MNRAFTILKASITLILAIAGIVFVVGFTDPETRWRGPSLVILGFSGVFVLLCVRVLIKAFRKEPGE